MLHIRDLRKSYGAKEAVRGVSFSLREGERLAFLGPNGAGKTTMIRCVSGRTRPDSGTIQWQGKSIELDGARENLGLVPQEIAVYGDLTTRENLIAFGRFHGLRGRRLRRQVDWALQWTGLNSRADDFVGSFSGGMKRRVNLACGVLHDPKIILLDEPTVGVDPQSRQRIFAMLDELSDGGASILLTTHHLDEAQSQSDRIVIVDQGQVVADGTFEQLVTQTVGASRIVKLRVDQAVELPVPNPSEPSSSALMGRTTTNSAEEHSNDRHPSDRHPDDQGERQPGHRPTSRRRMATLTAKIDDVAGDLPRVLQSAERQGYQIHDVEVQAPTLHHVFLHLTGHELRD
ncbi:MAG: ABC transporter ATP-binding protein [Planctomycetota bacterium]